MDRNVMLTLLLFGFCIPSSCLPRAFHYVNLKKTWTDAREYCRMEYFDLATIGSLEDVGKLDRPALVTSEAWVGLIDDQSGGDADSWRWSATGETSKTGYQVWSGGKPSSWRKEGCAVMDSLGGWTDMSCDDLRSFVCYTGTTTTDINKAYVFMSKTLKWNEAQDYCRTHHTDLPTIETSEENTEVYSAKPDTAEVWIGLYRTQWSWSDESDGLFRNWRSGEPNNPGGSLYCANEDAQHRWDDTLCTRQLAFLCQEAAVVKTVVRMKIQTDGDMADPAVSFQILQQLGAELKSRGRTDVTLRWKLQPGKIT